MLIGLPCQGRLGHARRATLADSDDLLPPVVAIGMLPPTDNRGPDARPFRGLRPATVLLLLAAAVP